MRIPSVILLQRTPPQNEKKVPFKEALPLKLKDHVSGKGGAQSDVACLHEMSILFACLKGAEFNESACVKEITSLKKCYKTFLDTKTQKKAEDKAGGMVTGKDLNYRQLNKYLRNYPQPK
ncbi:coiled-coil-helix-coiled-coil-helix domain-containing protein 1 [Phlebotomus papatasi]|uniref:CHCH domain-containing protein n=1 Tax=Phlebotomus papatasi TaxID=29031 RepID=A0A1B0DFY5_PHLPP|nr:coiled-coil-helix-coiled-coil-helix domain-containing protein 1 [Phlebotomus papatasi]